MRLLRMAKPLSVSKPGLAVMTTAAATVMAKVTVTSSLGNVDLPAQLLPGSVAEVIDMTTTKVATEGQLRHGLLVALAAAEMAMVTTGNRVGMALLHLVLLAEPHHGNDSKTHLHPLQVVSKTTAMEDILVVHMALPLAVITLLRA